MVYALLVHSKDFAVFIKYPAVHHGHANVAALGAVTKHRKGIEGGEKMGLIEIQRDDVRPVAYLDSAAVGSALNFSTVEGGHPDRIIGLHYGWILIVAVVHYGAKVQLLQHVQVIVAGCAVRLLVGQCTGDTPHSFISAISSSVTHTQWAARVGLSNAPRS